VNPRILYQNNGTTCPQLLSEDIPKTIGDSTGKGGWGLIGHRPPLEKQVFKNLVEKF